MLNGLWASWGSVVLTTYHAPIPGVSALLENGIDDLDVMMTVGENYDYCVRMILSI